MPPLVLAIEPDIRQAAIVKRIVREKVHAEVTVVDSRDAALEAMRTKVPDVVLLSTLLSPRDEGELIAHLRTLEHAEHLQTHTIPQLASTIGPGEEKRKGLLSAFKRRKGAGSGPAGCDPDLFAEEIRTYLERASAKKCEVRDTAARGPIAAAAAATKIASPGPERAEPAPDAGSGSSWSSPFEWRPADQKSSAIAHHEPAVREPAAFEPAVHEPAVHEPAVHEPAAFEPAAFEPAAFEPALHEPAVYEPAVYESAAFEPPAFEPEPEPPPEPPRVRYPLIVRTAKGWWFLEGEQPAPAIEPDSEMREVLASLAVPASVAAVGYAEGCRIRRVRVAAA